METQTTKEIRRFFSDLYGEYGEDERSLGWTKNKQNVRFEQLLKYVPKNNFSILDIGCGFGDLYQYILNDIELMSGLYDYHGIDIMSEFIEVAKKKYPSMKDHFECCDFIESDMKRQWDWVVESGIFGHMLFMTEDEMYSYISKVMQKALQCAKTGISFDFLSDRVDYRASNDCFFANPMRILEIAYGFSRNVVLNNGVMPFEFCITVWKNDSFKTETTIFNSYYEEEL